MVRSIVKFVCFILVVILAIDVIGHLDPKYERWAVPGLILAVCAVILWLTVKIARAWIREMPPDFLDLAADESGVHACDDCARCVVTLPVVFEGQIGMLILRKRWTLEAFLCEKCATKRFIIYTFNTLCLGWWGPIAFWVTPFLLAENVQMYASCLRKFHPTASRVIATVFLVALAVLVVGILIAIAVWSLRLTVAG